MRKNMNQAVNSFDAAAVLYREVTDRLLERLDYIKIAPECVLDLGCKTGYSLEALKQRFMQTSFYGYDPAMAMLNCLQEKDFAAGIELICADYDLFPLRSSMADMVVANLSFHFSPDMAKTLQECYRVLKPGGLLLFSTFGPDTLKELRESFRQFDPLPHIHDFLDMHDVGDLLVKSHFSDPVMDMEYITMKYERVERLLLDLKELGSANVRLDRRAGLMGLNAWQKSLNYYQHQFAENNKIPATHEIIYAIAWKSEKPASSVNESGEVVIPLDALLARKNKEKS